MALQIPKLQPGLLVSLPFEVQDWIRQLTNITPVETITITSVSGVSGTSSGGNAPTLTITLGNITPTTVATGAITGTTIAGTAITATSINLGQTTLSYYGEGTWTPADVSGGGVAFSLIDSTYTRVGRLVVARAHFFAAVNVDASTITIGGLPFTSSKGSLTTLLAVGAVSSPIYARTVAGTTTLNVLNAGGTNLTNASISGATIDFTVSYEV